MSVTDAITPVETGTYYTSWEHLKEKVEDWSIFAHFSFNIVKKDQTRVDYRCRDKGCPWRVYASLTKRNEIQVKIVLDQHTCAGMEQTIWEVSNTQCWLRRVVPKHLFVTRDTEVREIIDCIRMHYNVTVNREAARITRAYMIHDRREHQEEQFKKIPAYLTLLRSKNPYLHAELQTVNNSENESLFQRVFICPVQSQLSFVQMRRFMAMDGTFLKARFVQTLLLAVGVDANSHNLLLAWAVVESENKASWTWFLNLLKQAIPQALQMTLISDRDKGLMAADEILGENVDRLICCFHLKGNFCKRFNRSLETFFWPIANARTVEEFSQKITELRQTNEAAADYLNSIDLSLWVTAYL